MSHWEGTNQNTSISSCCRPPTSHTFLDPAHVTTPHLALPHDISADCAACAQRAAQCLCMQTCFGLWTDKNSTMSSHPPLHFALCLFEQRYMTSCCCTGLALSALCSSCVTCGTVPTVHTSTGTHELQCLAFSWEFSVHCETSCGYLSPARPPTLPLPSLSPPLSLSVGVPDCVPLSLRRSLSPCIYTCTYITARCLSPFLVSRSLSLSPPLSEQT